MMVRYYGYYSNAARGKRRKREEALCPTPPVKDSPPASLRAMRWAELIRRVFEVDPLACPECSGSMSLISFITESHGALIDKILTHLGEDTSPPKATGPPLWVRRLRAAEHNATYAHVYDVEDGHQESQPDEVTIDYGVNWGA